MGRLFKRKKYASVSGGEMIVTMNQQKAYELRKRLDDLVEQERCIDDTEVSEAVAKAISKRIEQLNNSINKTPHTCTQCGAPLKDGKCEYCKTNYN